MMQQPGVPMENPGQTLGIIGLVLNFLGINLGGIILGIMSRNKSKQYGMSTTLGTVSLVWGIIGMVLGFFLIVFWVILIVAAGIQEAGSTPSSSSPIDYSSSSIYSTD